MHLSSTRVRAQLAARWCAKGQQQKFAGRQKCSPAVVLSKIVLCMSARLSINSFARIRKSTLYTGLATGSTFLARLCQCRSLWWMVFRLWIFATTCVRN